jgi:uncharacterized protein involved in oxidation of intracellular sulfur
VKILFIINDAPYGSEKAFNALRMAKAIQKERADVEVLIFLMADAVSCALPSQSTPHGYYNIELMLKAVISKGAQVKACGLCSEARGLKELTLLEGVRTSAMAELAQWTIEADKILTF